MSATTRHVARTQQPSTTQSRPHDQGFTMVEMLATIILIGVLVLIAVTSFLNQRKNAHDAGVKSDLVNVSRAQYGWAASRPAGTLAIATQDKDALLATGARFTVGNVLSIAAGPTGYCMRGHNPAGRAAGTVGGYYWFDSTLGGLQSQRSMNAPTGGSCEDFATEDFEVIDSTPSTTPTTPTGPTGPVATPPPPPPPPSCLPMSVAGQRGRIYPDIATTNENTVLAFNNAMNGGAIAVSADLHRLAGATSTVVPTAIVHDETWTRTINPTTMGTAPTQVDLTTAAQRAALRTNGGQRVPTFEELAAWSGSTGAPVYLDVKDTFTTAQATVLFNYAQSVGATIVPFGDLADVSPFRSAGFEVGTDNETLTFSAYQSANIVFVQAPTTMDATLIGQLKAAGITVSSDPLGYSGYATAKTKGFSILLANNPGQAVTWARSQCS